MNLKKIEPFVLAFAIVLPTIVTWIYFVSLKDSPPSSQQSAYSIGKAIQFTLPFVWVLLCCRKQLSGMLPWVDANFEGAGDQDRRPSMAIGIGFGMLVAASVFIGFYFIVKPLGIADQAVAKLNEKVAGLSFDSPLKFALLGLFYALVHSFMEEYYWRWFVFKRLLDHVKFGTAIILSSVGFMAHHVILLATYFGWDSPMAYLISATVAIGGMVWAWLYHRSGKLVGPWISHMIADAGIFALGYVLVFGWPTQ